MNTGKGRIDETFIKAERAARISCPPGLVPAPGQYLLAWQATEHSAPLPHPIFQAESTPTGFIAAAPLPPTWNPGTELTLRGPHGRGFHLPTPARKIALAAYGATSARLLALLRPAQAQHAEIVLHTSKPPANLPPAIEISPLTALPDTLAWCDYLAVDLPPARLEAFLGLYQHSLPAATELLIETPLACGGIAECGVCAIHPRAGQKFACSDGPVFPHKDLTR